MEALDGEESDVEMVDDDEPVLPEAIVQIDNDELSALGVEEVSNMATILILIVYTHNILGRWP